MIVKKNSVFIRNRSTRPNGIHAIVFQSCRLSQNGMNKSGVFFNGLIVPHDDTIWQIGRGIVFQKCQHIPVPGWSPVKLKTKRKNANKDVMKTYQALLYVAWKKLIVAYLLSLIIGLVTGTLLVKIGHIEPERLYEVSTKRLSYALPVFDMGIRHGIDMGVLLFVWNAVGALTTLSFVYTAALLNPYHMGLPPQGVRKIFCGKTRMKLLCYLPGCAKIEEEALRRVYVWLMVPLLGIILLGMESGLQVSTATYLFGSFFSAIISLLPHGLIEIPSLAIAGAVTYSAHLLVNKQARSNTTLVVFQQIETHRNTMPIMKIALMVIGGLFLAGWVEAHVTQRILTVM
jgi:hypothetical protein